ncbi:hypothetical protein [Wohlfahrtiimonas chitiniclastica]|uniref:hypothetical protein n=1 Tax=Wohlfahrtiimonas chitiniclastica TaxID=400946 RepID=UPI000B997F3C|nr:hypothetical protein [Wohlfahrtiimonas chitiniclastica]OYQ76059.1 hypothetical protein B9T18_01510 [Wohlfahrtiimonas chitiniclastica]
MKKILITIMPLLLTGCVTTETVELSNEFNAKDAAFIYKSGKNTIKGNAFLRQNSGNVVTCAGNDVMLIPVTAYSQERMGHIYKLEDVGFLPIYNSKITFNNDSNDYKSMIKNVKCNSDGQFEFNNVANGNYYVVAYVIWKAGSYQGGSLMKKVSVKNGSTEKLIMTL